MSVNVVVNFVGYMKSGQYRWPKQGEEIVDDSGYRITRATGQESASRIVVTREGWEPTVVSEITLHAPIKGFSSRAVIQIGHRRGQWILLTASEPFQVPNDQMHYTSIVLTPETTKGE